MNGTGAKYIVNEQLEKVRSAARALLRDVSSLPQARVDELRVLVCAHLKLETLTTEVCF